MADRRTFIINSLEDRYAEEVITQIPRSDVKEIKSGIGLSGVTKKSHVTIGKDSFIMKNHSYLGFDGIKSSSPYKLLKRKISKYTKLANAGTKDVRYRYSGTPHDIINITSAREAIASNLLTYIENSAKKEGSPPFHAARMQLLIDKYDETNIPRFRVLSKHMDFRQLDQFLYSAKNNVLTPYKNGKKPAKVSYPILNNNQWFSDGELKSIDKRSLAFASILPAIFADYDLPGKRGQNLGINEKNNKLAIFDFGHSLSPGWLKQRNVTSDLKAHDFQLTGILHQRRLVSLKSPENLIRKYRGQQIINIPLEDKINAFKEVYNAFINHRTGKESNAIKKEKYHFAKILHALKEEGMITKKQLRYYKSKVNNSLNAFVNRLKYIYKVMTPRLDLSSEQIGLLETIELLTSRTIPTPLSPTGFIFQNDKRGRGITHRHAFELYGDYLITGSTEGAHNLSFLLEKNASKVVKPFHKNGAYYFPLHSIPKEWFISPFSQAGKKLVNSCLNNLDVSNEIYKEHSDIFSKDKSIGDISINNISCFTDDIIQTIKNIRQKGQKHGANKRYQDQQIFQFLNTPCISQQEDKQKTENYKHHTLWEALHHILEQEKSPKASLRLDSRQQLKLIEKQFAPEHRSQIYDLGGNSLLK